MDADRFDAISRVLGTEAGRRGMVKVAAGSALALLGLSRLPDSASARRCGNDDDCRRNDVCDRGKCVECKSDRNCSRNQVCNNNRCVDCIRNRDCGRNQRCVNRRCRRRR
jgi:hypothetical protein